MSKESKPQRGRRSIARIPMEQTTRDFRLIQRMHHERITELSIMLALLAGVATLAGAPLLFVGHAWGLPVFGTSATLLGVGILIYLRALSKVNVIDKIEEIEHRKWAAEIKEIVAMDWEEEPSEKEEVQEKAIPNSAREFSEVI